MNITNLAVPKPEPEEDERVPVTARILNTITEIRDSGVTNMFDIEAVQYHANDRDCYSTVCWIQNNKALYARGITKGFKVMEVTNENV